MRIVGIPASATALAVAVCCVAAFPTAAAAATHHEVGLKMGSRFEITAVHPDAAQAQAAVTAAWEEIERIEARISSWRDSSETSAVNRAAGSGPVEVSAELFGLLRRALKVGALTDGAFDITFAGAGRLWDFKADPPAVPDAQRLREALELVDWRQVRLDPGAGTVELPRAGMRIGLGGIGKGYAANRAAKLLREAGVSGGVVNAGGDLFAFGAKEDGSPWTVAVADPFDRDAVFAYLQLDDQAVVTSGDYESFIEVDGKRYAHILDPRTGYPVEELRSVTIVCPDAELADALATGVFVLGVRDGLALVDRMRGVEAMLVDASGQLHFSQNLRSLFRKDGE